MSTTVNFNGTTYSLPENRTPRGWGVQLAAFLVDVANNSLSKAGGNFTLTADVNFGTSFGLVSKYVKYSSGTLMLNTSGVVTVPNATDTLVGKATTDTLTNKTLTSPVINTPTGIVKADVGLGNVDNTSDANKPVSTATQTELNLKAPIANPTFTGTVGGVTASMVGLGNVDNTSNATERAASATLTNKTLTAPILDQAVFTEAAAPSTPASGKLAIYAKTDSKLYKKDDAGVETEIGAGGAGSGEINAISNSIAVSDTTGWTGTTRVTSGSPLDPVTTTAFSIANTATTESETSGGYASITTLAAPLRSMKLKVEFWYTTPATDVYAVSVYAGSTRLSLSSDSSSVTTLPANTTGKFTASFDSTTATAYSLNITRTSGSTGACIITNVVVGPGTIVQGAAVSEWQSYTPTYANITTTGATGRWRRVGDSMEVVTEANPNGTATGTITVSLPSGYTINTTALTSTSGTTGLLGIAKARALNGATADVHTGFVQYASTTTVQIVGNDSAGGENVWATSTPRAWAASGDSFALRFTVPVAEWAGSGTVNLGAGAQVEYAFNTTATATSGTYTSNKASGPAGTAILSYSLSGTNSAGYDVDFQYPIQNDDVIALEFNDGNGWVDAATRSGYFSQNDAGTTYYGVQLVRQTSTNTVRVFFYSAFNQGAAWSVLNSNGWKWRVRKAKAGAAVGFGMAGTDGSAGLYKAGLAPGLTTGAAVPAGYVGEVIRASNTATPSVPTSGQYGDGSSITLTAGTWRIDAGYFVNRNGATLTGTTLGHGVSVTTGNSNTGLVNPVNQAFTFIGSTTTANLFTATSISFLVRCDGTTITRIDDNTAFGASTTLYHKVYCDGYSAATPYYNDKLTATRIA